MKTRWLVPVLALLAAGCIKEKTLVVVNPDGSGNIVLDTAMTAETAAMMKQTVASFAGAFGETNAPAEEQELIKEEDLRKRAADFGSGVEFVRLKRTSEGGGQGAIALYQFKDVNTVRLPLQQKGGDAGEEPPEAKTEEAKPKKVVTFSFTPGETKSLKITIPQEEEKKEETAEAKPDLPAEAAAMAEGMMGPMLQMFKGLQMSMAVQVKGEVVKSTASHREGEKGERAVLMALNFDELLKSPKFAPIFQKSQGGDMPTDELLGLPGFTFETNREVVVEFR